MKLELFLKKRAFFHGFFPRVFPCVFYVFFSTGFSVRFLRVFCIKSQDFLLLFLLVLSVNVERSIKMDKIKNEIKTMKNTLNNFEDALVMCQVAIKEGEKSQESLELKLSINEWQEERLTRLENYIDVIHKHLNATISRVNDIHVYLRKHDLKCYEVIEDTDDEVMDDTNDKKTV